MAGRGNRGFRWTLAATFWAVCIGSTAHCAPQEPAAGDAGIKQAIEQLGAATHAEREAAVGRLIDIGGPAVDALQKATGSDDPEVAFRAREALKLIRLGIDSATPRAVRRLAVGIFKEEDGGVRRVARRKLAEKGEPGRRVLRFMAWCGDGGTEQAKRLLRLAYVGDVEQLTVEPADVGYVKELIVDGRFDEAEFALWMRCAADPDDADDLIAYCMVRGTLEKALAEAKTFYARRPRESTALLIARLHLTAGDREQAIAAARLAGITGLALIEAPLVDAGDWKGLAELYDPLMEAQGDDLWDEQTVRALGMLATCYRLSDQKEKSEAVIERINEIARKHYLPASKRDEQPQRSRARAMIGACIEGLVMNRRTDDGVALAVAAGRHERAAWMRRMQGRFEDADVLHERPDQERADTEKPDDLWDRLWDARRFLRKGQRQEALTAAAQAAAAVTDRTAARRIMLLIQLERDLGLQEQAEQRLKDLLGDGTDNERVEAAMEHWHGVAGAAGWAWWIIAGRTMPDIEPVERLRTAEKMALHELSEEEFRGGLPAALRVAEAARAEDEEAQVPEAFRSRDGGERRGLFEAIGDACDHYGMPAEAVRCYDECFDLSEDQYLLIQSGQIMAKAEKWDEAVKYFARAREHEHWDLADLYRLGWALEKAGKPQEGRQKMATAELLALGYRRWLISVMEECGHADAAEREEERRARLTWSVDDQLALVPLPSEITGDYGEALRRRRRQFVSYMMGRRDCMFAAPHFAAVAYLEVNRALAELSEGRPVDIEKVAQDIMDNSPAEEEGVILLVTGLDRFGRKDLADRVFERSMDALNGVYGKRQSHDGMNEIAWLAGSCGRDLDRALRLAVKVCDQDPTNAAYLDTLGQVYFSRGEFDKAVETERKALHYGDHGWYIQAAMEFWHFQLKRFEAALAEQKRQAVP